MKTSSVRTKIRSCIDHFLNCAFIRTVDLPYHIANHLIGPDHTPVHRKTMGVLVILMGGVIIGVVNSFSGYMLLHVTGDIIGNSVHAIGFLPFIKEIEGNAIKNI